MTPRLPQNGVLTPVSACLWGPARERPSVSYSNDGMGLRTGASPLWDLTDHFSLWSHQLNCNVPSYSIRYSGILIIALPSLGEEAAPGPTQEDVLMCTVKYQLHEV